MIDVDELFFDPLFFQPMQVWRRLKTYDANGNPVETYSFVTPEPLASIQSGDNPELHRLPDMATTADVITIYTNFILYEEGDQTGNPQNPTGTIPTDGYGNALDAPGTVEYRADVIMFHGSPYEVFYVQDWTDYGIGFIEAFARRITTQNAQMAS